MEQFSAPRPRTARAVLLSFALLAFGGRAARAQSFEAATIADYVYPSALAQPAPTNTSAHSVAYCGGYIGAYTWDDDEGLSGSSGLAVTITDNTGGTAETNLIFGDRASLEVAILTADACAGGGVPFLLLTYYDISGNSFEYDVYQLSSTITATGLLLPQLNPVVANAPIAAGYQGIVSDVPFGRIRNDAWPMENKAAVIWEADNGIYASTFSFASLTFTEPTQLLPDNVAGDFAQPDIALQSSGGETYVYPVFTTADKGSLFVLQLPYTALPAGSPLSATVVDMQTTTGTYNLPRMDAPDYLEVAGSTVWGYVVMEEVDSKQKIFTGVNDDYTGSTYHRYLNDGSAPYTGLSSIADMSVSGNPQRNLKPVLAFGDWDFDINAGVYYGWYFQSWQQPTNLSSTGTGYIGLKVDRNMDLAWDDTKYYVVNDDVDNTSDYPSVSFSGNNTLGHFGLFAAFTGYDNSSGSGYMMGYKAVPYTYSSFRPLGLGGLGKNTLGASVYPNPGTLGFALAAAYAGTLDLDVTDITGRGLWQASGTVQALSGQLRLRSAGWPAGSYLLKLAATDGSGTATLKAVKLR
ncbi:MAG: T9SS type A sorting domain-containing protein [Edaphocola sp.]